MKSVEPPASTPYFSRFQNGQTNNRNDSNELQLPTIRTGCWKTPISNDAIESTHFGTRAHKVQMPHIFLAFFHSRWSQLNFDTVHTHLCTSFCRFLHRESLSSPNGIVSTIWQPLARVSVCAMPGPIVHNGKFGSHRYIRCSLPVARYINSSSEFGRNRKKCGGLHFNLFLFRFSRLIVVR